MSDCIPLSQCDDDHRFDNQKLEFLYLRANGLDDDTVVQMSEKLRTSRLKCLDLSLNIFGQRGLAAIVEGVKDNYVLEYLGFASLGFTISDLRPLLGEFGKFKLTPEETEALQQRIKERDAIVEKNKKAKGKKEEPVPQVPNMAQDELGNSYVLKKEQFKHLNIGLNSLDDLAFEELDKLMTRTPAQFILTISNRFMSKETLKALSTKYGSRVIT